MIVLRAIVKALAFTTKSITCGVMQYRRNLRLGRRSASLTVTSLRLPTLDAVSITASR
jgi:hypothetical protein